MTNERRQALIARIEELQEQQSSHWTGNYPGHQLDLKIWEIALATLTNETVRVPDESTLADEHIAWMEQSLPRNTFSEEEWEEISLYTWLAWRDSRRSAGNTDIKRLAFIDSPAQQHEAQADENQKPGKEECVHEWRTEEDYDGEPLFIECIKCGCR